MNIRLPYTLEAFPAAVQRLPAAIRRSDSRTRLIASLLAILAALALVWYFAASTPPAHTMPAPPVKVALARRSDVTVVEHTLGTVVANATVQVTARVSGQLLSAGFTEGDVVHAGDLLFQIDPRPFQAALAQADAALAKDQASLVSATNDEHRYEALAAQGAASSMQRDQAVATAKGFVATVQSDRAAITVARLNLAYTQIRSPIDGKTGPILIQPGNVVTAGGGGSSAPTSGVSSTVANTSSGASNNSSSGGSNPLVVITQIQPVKVSFSLPQSDLPRIQSRERDRDLTATIGMHDATGKPLQAAVDFVGNAVSAQTGTIELRATFPNRDASLVPGQLVDVTVGLDTLEHAIVVPREAVNIGPDGRYVYVVNKDGNAEFRQVTELFDAGATVAISGAVKPGDRVITDGQLRVIPGKPVSVVAPHAGPPTKS